MFKKMIISSLTALLLYSCDQSQMEDLKGKAREVLSGSLKQSTVNKLLGEPPAKIKLPPIPQIEKDATSTDIYTKKDSFSRQNKEFESLSSEEKRKYRIAYIQELYEATRNASPKEEDVVNFLNVLEQGGSREGVYRAVVLDSVYASLEQFEEKPEQELIDFSAKFGEKYLGRRFSKNAMADMNLWSIKRILVEKSLEVMDALSSNPKDLKSWYAVLSAELAKKYPSLWKNDVRRMTDPEFHFEWASRVPLQQIKSELIIKLHQTMNSLNN